jgi:hypothetical protein
MHTKPASSTGSAILELADNPARQAHVEAAGRVGVEDLLPIHPQRRSMPEHGLTLL